MSGVTLVDYPLPRAKAGPAGSCGLLCFLVPEELGKQGLVLGSSEAQEEPKGRG